MMNNSSINSSDRFGSWAGDHQRVQAYEHQVSSSAALLVLAAILVCLMAAIALFMADSRAQVAGGASGQESFKPQPTKSTVIAMEKQMYTYERECSQCTDEVLPMKVTGEHTIECQSCGHTEHNLLTGHIRAFNDRLLAKAVALYASDHPREVLPDEKELVNYWYRNNGISSWFVNAPQEELAGEAIASAVG